MKLFSIIVAASLAALSTAVIAQAPLGVSIATTWLNLMTIGAWARTAVDKAARDAATMIENNFISDSDE